MQRPNGWRGGGRNAQALRIVTRSNMLLTQSVDEDESSVISLDDGVSAYRQQFIGGSVFIDRAASAGYSSSQKKKKNVILVSDAADSQ